MAVAVRPALDLLSAGASRYLTGVLVGVLFAPVLPDIAVDLLGGSPVRNASLRIGALLLVALACAGTYAAQLRLTARRARRAAPELAGIGRCEVLVVPLGLNAGYAARGVRTGAKTILEWLVDTSRPSVVVGVATEQTRERSTSIRDALAADGIDYEAVELGDVADPRVALPEAEREVVARFAASGLAGRRCYVDTTGGTVPMSLAMLRIATVLGAECTYVASRYENRVMVPGSQTGSSFDPTTFFTPTP